MKNSGWIVFWVCLFSYWGFKLYLNNELEITKLQTQKEIDKIHKESSDKMIESLKEMTHDIDK